VSPSEVRDLLKPYPLTQQEILIDLIAMEKQENSGAENPGELLRDSDAQTNETLSQIIDYERVLSNRISGVKTVLVVISARGMAFDREALRTKIAVAYPDAKVFFKTTQNASLGEEIPAKVDLLIDFTGPGERQSWCFAKKLRKMARVVVGRNAGWFRRKIYDRVFDESASPEPLSEEILERERAVQKHVLAMAGIPLFQMSNTPPDLGKTIALELPGMRKL